MGGANREEFSFFDHFEDSCSSIAHRQPRPPEILCLPMLDKQDPGPKKPPIDPGSDQ